MHTEFYLESQKVDIGRPRLGWVVSNRIELTEMDYMLTRFVSGYYRATGSFEHGIELSGSIKGKEFHDPLSSYWLLKKDPAPLS
jgi:hypothetical protein